MHWRINEFLKSCIISKCERRRYICLQSDECIEKFLKKAKWRLATNCLCNAQDGVDLKWQRRKFYKTVADLNEAGRYLENLFQFSHFYRKMIGLTPILLTAGRTLYLVNIFLCKRLIVRQYIMFYAVFK